MVLRSWKLNWHTGGITRKAWQGSGKPTGEIRGPIRLKESVRRRRGKKSKGVLQQRAAETGMTARTGSLTQGAGATQEPSIVRVPASPSLSPQSSGPQHNTRRLPGRRRYIQPSSSPFSPDEDRRRPSFLLSIFSSSYWSRSCRRCHLKTPPAWGRGRRDRKPGK